MKEAINVSIPSQFSMRHNSTVKLKCNHAFSSCITLWFCLELMGSTVFQSNKGSHCVSGFLN